MKTILQTLLLLCTVNFANAQIVNIPDPHFKDALLNHDLFGGDIIDTNGDGEIQVSEAEAITVLIVGDPFIQGQIQDMTGIEAFVNITELYCFRNQISSLDLSENIALTFLECQENQLSSLNLSENIALEYLDCSDNLLVSLDVRNGNNHNIDNASFRSQSNPDLKCIFVDDTAYSDANWFLIDPASTFVETQQECDNLGFSDFFLQYTKIYPNPVQNILNIELPEHPFQILSVNIIDAAGKAVFQTTKIGTDSQIDLTSLPPGFYFLILYNENGLILTKKLVKS